MPQPPRELTPERSARHLFGAKLRAYREGAKMSLEALKQVVNLSTSHLSRIENATAMPPPDLPRALDACFGTDGIFVELYRLCARESHPDQFQRRMELEARARLVQEYSGQLVPGLLQTEAYARAQFREHDPKAAPDEVDELVTARMARQSLVNRADPADYTFVLDEAVIRRRFGTAEEWRHQLARLEAAADTPNGTLQVHPFARGGHGLMGGYLSLLHLPDGTAVAYEEAITTGWLLEETHEVIRRQRAYDRLTAYALTPSESAALIRSVIEEIEP
ncbi:helix-turn-helix domain-containing protein [Streptomyces alkaliterrae]|uniref:Helix-turn-helix domain-containing protein n=1 Tax=Streptomyces alkaliterrae TaxID=2213162 RepID=A0A5P0YIZ6_9ACTN|nr:helix-turn-helix transcriptional regulator [Streptomyces alkaliterrae]MBB1259325.1 helix-turn-helix transcriptional regulator [Streptomyces alkaliterrae]MQS00296.1 helix-turn-helix domain-containing protein [Streptomyces alkaliterrae]